MASVAQIRLGLKARLATIYGLNPYDAEGGQITPPAAVIVTPAIDYHQAFSTAAVKRYDFRVLVLVAQGLLSEAAHTLDLYADPNSAQSVKAALEADQTLGGVAQTLVVENFRPLNAEEVAALQYWGGEFFVTVFAS